VPVSAPRARTARARESRALSSASDEAGEARGAVLYGAFGALKVSAAATTVQGPIEGAYRGH